MPLEAEEILTTPRIQAVAFDMDGLMFNTEDLYDQVGQVLLERRGQEFTLDLKLEMMGLPGRVAFEIMRKRCQLSESVEQLQAETNEIFHGILPAEIATMPGLETLLGVIEGLNLPKAVATSSHRKFATEALGYFELEPRFEFVLTSEDVTQGKPHPEIYLTAAARLGVEPQNLLVLEDSHTGSTAASAAGAFTIAVPTSHSLALDFSHVDRVASRLDDPLVLELFG
ncbi:MAG: HAD superfamily hydrolase (TIGR01509 family) [Mariniblastus sp.]|jgi:HAD superfamily hydrolase (TIGR01509 family)